MLAGGAQVSLRSPAFTPQKRALDPGSLVLERALLHVVERLADALGIAVVVRHLSLLRWMDVTSTHSPLTDWDKSYHTPENMLCQRLAPKAR